MTREQAREYINNQMSEELKIAPKQSGGYDTYVCPLCGNGSGENGTGLSKHEGHLYKCFKCGFYGDYFSLRKKELDAESDMEVFEEYGLEIDGVESDPNSIDSVDIDEVFSSMITDELNYILLANRALQHSTEGQAYLQRRGISLQTAKRCVIGYSPNWRSPAALKKGKNPPASKRIIIPTGNGSYMARAIDESIDEQYKRMKEGTAGIFHKIALRGDKPVYITEGAFDALSIIEVGGEAIALGGTSGVGLFLDHCKTKPPTVPLIVSMDNDGAGKKATEQLRAGLKSLNIPFTELNVAARYKDANDHLVANREAFTAIINSEPEKSTVLIAEIMQQASEEEKAAYLATSTANQIDAFIAEIAANADKSAISTGFQRLDDALDGGLYEGLYILGAISSLGKTTFVLQIADQIAHTGQDVLIFSLEMSRNELMAKSISRLTLEHCNGDIVSAKSNREIQSGWKWKYFDDTARQLVNRCIDIYRNEYSGHIYIHEAVGTIGVEHIKTEVHRHISHTGNVPVVVIDYLQILKPFDMRATDKQNTDTAVHMLKILSRDKKIPIIAISSFNRDNYTAPVNMASFKESGAIEYSSDVLLGLQLAGMDELSQSETKKAETIRKIDEWKKDIPRKVELKMLKNRNGQTGVTLPFSYYSKYNSFKDATGADSLKNQAQKAGEAFWERTRGKA